MVHDFDFWKKTPLMIDFRGVSLARKLTGVEARIAPLTLD
jgi:hypothetical protein